MRCARPNLTLHGRGPGIAHGCNVPGGLQEKSLESAPLVNPCSNIAQQDPIEVLEGGYGHCLFLFLCYSFISRDCPIASVLWLCLEDRPQRQEIQRSMSQGTTSCTTLNPPWGKATCVPDRLQSSPRSDGRTKGDYSRCHIGTDPLSLSALRRDHKRAQHATARILKIRGIA